MEGQKKKDLKNKTFNFIAQKMYMAFNKKKTDVQRVKTRKGPSDKTVWVYFFLALGEADWNTLLAAIRFSMY